MKRSVGSMRTRRRVRAAAVVTTALAVFAAVPASSDAAPISYVALGDSFVSGPGIPNQSLSPLGCMRSDHNYARIAAPRLGGATLRDVSCSFAKTDHMAAKQVTLVGTNPPQFNALDPSVNLVTLGIGGNDIKYLAWECPSLLPMGQPCRDKYVRNGRDILADNIAATAPKVAANLTGIRQRAPSARVLVIGYPAILPDTGNGCWPAIPVSPNDVTYLRGVHKKLNAMLAQQAAAHGATYVDMYTPSIGHDACKRVGTRWVEPLVPAALTLPFHPNPLGMQKMADVVVANAR